MFSEGLEEFDDSRHVVQDLIEEYEACETPDYMNYVSKPSFIQFLLISIWNIGFEG